MNRLKKFLNVCHLAKATLFAHSNPIADLPRMAAVLTDGRLFYVGLNARKTHPLQARYAKHPEAIELHAEIAAIAKAKAAGHTDLSSFRLYVARVTRDGTTALAKPCKGCARAIKKFKIQSVEWTK